MRIFTRWDERAKTGETNELLLRLARMHASEIQDASIRNYLPRISNDTIPGLCSLVLPYAAASEAAGTGGNRFLLAADLYHIGQITAFFKKRADIDIGIDKRKVALDSFKTSEDSCRQTNHIFRTLMQGGLQLPPAVDSVLHTASRKISEVLGDVPTFDELRGYFGPGATTQLPKRMACAKEKLSQPLACSGDMAPCLTEALESLPHLFEFGENEVVTVAVEIHPGKLVTVPKSYKTDRTVMIEPWLNSFYQLGVGRYIARQLRKVGVDVSNQDLNKGLARNASLTGALATLDLSSASDSIAVKLVEHLLPPDWYNLLSVLRTSKCANGDEVFTLEKFSSMGNGYTFALESLIFWALASSVPGCSSSTAVYGDDIIVPTGKVEAVIKVLEVCGFSINKEKSFVDGCFRESCGGDYFLGIDIRPCFIKDSLTGQDMFRLHNFYVKRGLPAYANVVLEFLAEDLRLYGPEGYGDGHLITDDRSSHYRSRKLKARGWSGYLFDTYRWNPRKIKRARPGDRILPVYSTYLKSVETDEGLLPPDDETVWYSIDLTAVLGQSEGEICKPHKPPADGWASKPVAGLMTADRIPVETLPGTKGYSRISIYTLG